MVFHRPDPHRFHAPAPLQDVQRVPSCRLLGTVILSSLSVRDHVDYTLTVSSQRLYLLNKLCARPHDMPRPCTPHAVAQLQPIHASRLRLPARLVSSSLGALNIHDVRDRQTSDSIIAQCPAY